MTLRQIISKYSSNTLIYILVLALITIANIPVQRLSLERNEIESQSAAINLAKNQFTDQTAQSGLWASHSEGGQQLMGLDETLGPGLCLLDFDNDGWMDVFIPAGSGHTYYHNRTYWWQKKHHHRLYKNLGGFFADVSPYIGLDINSHSMGCVTADWDRDGYTDLLILNKGKNLLLRNNQGKFVDVTTTSRIIGDNWSTSAVPIDANNDGLLDIYIVNFIDYKKGQRNFAFNAGYQNTAPEFNPEQFDGIPNQLWINTGNMVFKESTAEFGLLDGKGRGMSAAVFDANHDGLQDIYLSNAGGSPNRLLINNPKQAFIEVSNPAGVADNFFSSYASILDINNDGSSDIMVASQTNGNVLAYIAKTDTTAPNPEFVDQSRELGFKTSQYASLRNFSIMETDFDNDAQTELLMLNSALTPDPDSQSVTLAQQNFIWQRDVKHYPIQYSASGLHHSPALSSRSASVYDFDHDGDLDLVIAANNGQLRYLQNEATSANNWVVLDFSKNTEITYGSKVILTTDTSITAQQYQAHVTYMGWSNTQQMHIGLGQATKIKTIEVKLPKGSTRKYKNIPINQVITFEGNKVTSAALQPAEKKIIEPHLLISLVSLLSEPITNKPSDESMQRKSAFESAVLRALKIADSLTQQRAIKIVIASPSPFGERLIAQAAEDKSPEVRIDTVHAIEKYKTVPLLRWLLELLNDKNDQVKIAAVQAYGRLLEDDEAYPFHKKLGIRSLIHLAQTATPDAQTAAISALGYAEDYRASTYLDELKTQRLTEQTSLALLAAISNSKERSHKEYLIEIANSTSSPIHWAKAVLALYQLGDTTSGANIIMSGLSTKTSPSISLPRLGTLAKINSVNPVIHPSLINEQFAKIKNGLQKLDSNSYSTSTAIGLIYAYQNLDPNKLSEVKAIMNNHSDQSVRNVYTNAILDSLPQERNHLLQKLIASKSFQDLEIASAWLSNNPTSFEPAFFNILNKETTLFNQLIDTLLNQGQISQRRAIVNQILALPPTHPFVNTVLKGLLRNQPSPQSNANLLSDIKKLIDTKTSAYNDNNSLPEFLKLWLAETFEASWQYDYAGTILKNPVAEDALKTQAFELLKKAPHPIGTNTILSLATTNNTFQGDALLCLKTRYSPFVEKNLLRYKQESLSDNINYLLSWLLTNTTELKSP